MSGYNLDQLLPENGFNVARALVGSEGTCVNVLEATVRLVPSPQHRRTVIFSYPDVFTAADHVPAILAASDPIGLEGYDDFLLHNMEGKGRLAAERALLPEGGAWLYVEFGDDDADRGHRARPRPRSRPSKGGPQLDAKCVIAKAEQLSVWKVRESAVGDSRLPGVMEAEGAWEDAAVHPDRLGAYLRDFQQLLDDHGYRCVYYGHFGQGCVHTRMDFDFKTAAGLRTFRSFMEKAADLVVAHGGSLAGEYGEGHGRAELLPRMFGPELMDAFHQFKRIWDPDWKMNPNRLIGDVKLDEGLRAGPDYRPPQLDDPFRLSGRRRLVRERDRALLRNGEVPQPGHADDVPELPGHARGAALDPRPRPAAVRDAEGRPADRRLARRGRQGLARAVPVVQGVHGRLPRPGRHPDLQGRVPRPLLRPARPAAAPLRARADAVVGPGRGARPPARQRPLAAPRQLAPTAKRLIGLAPERDAPRFARQTFRSWFHQRGRPPNTKGQRLILWPDTFTNLFEPEVGQAAVEVLEAAGFAVELPRAPAVLRPSAVRLRDARHRQARAAADPRRALRPDRSRARRWSRSSRAAAPCSATSCAS